jgi:hypothetical protein
MRGGVGLQAAALQGMSLEFNGAIDAMLAASVEHYYEGRFEEVLCGCGAVLEPGMEECSECFWKNNSCDCGNKLITAGEMHARVCRECHREEMEASGEEVIWCPGCVKEDISYPLDQYDGFLCRECSSNRDDDWW